MRPMRIIRAGWILVAAAFLFGATGASAAPAELQIWSAFPELHDQATWIANKYMEKNPNVKIKTTLFPQRALEEKVAVGPAGRPVGGPHRDGQDGLLSLLRGRPSGPPAQGSGGLGE